MWSILNLKGVGCSLPIMLKSSGAQSSSRFTCKLLATWIINTEFKIFYIIHQIKCTKVNSKAQVLSYLKVHLPIL